jgi:hypothetical protein
MGEQTVGWHFHRWTRWLRDKVARILAAEGRWGDDVGVSGTTSHEGSGSAVGALK